MEIRRLTATFGALENRTLTLGQGFQLIYAPNESGKSTWCAFLRAMLYGLPTRDRRPDADKNRYAPWSGAAMEGRMDLTLDGRGLTILRRTRTPSAPMGAFSAVYTGTSQPVEGLDAAGCGQRLTGVPREVYERSAFIAQNGMALRQTAELERRVAALMTSGEEDVSRAEAAERLKKYLSRRRYNRTGLLPALEGEIADLSRRLARSEALLRQVADAESALPPLERQERALAEELLRRERQAGGERRRQLDALQRELDAAALRTAFCRQETSLLPSRAELSAWKSAAGNLQVNRLTLDSLRRRLALRERETAQAREGTEAFPLFASLTAQEAGRRAQADQEACRALRRRIRRAWLLLLPALLLLSATALRALLRPAGLPLTLGGMALSLSALSAGVVLIARSRRRLRDLSAAYGVDSFTRLSDAYAAAYELLTDCQEREREARLRLKSLTEAMEQAEAEILAAAGRLSPKDDTFGAAVAAIDDAIACWNRLSAAQQEQALLTARRDALSDAPPDAAGGGEETGRLLARREEARQALEEARRDLSAAQGQLQLAGSPDTLRPLLEEKRRQRDALQREYDAAALALEALDEADAVLQSRFAPELGKKSAEYFAKLTGGKYNTVLLNRELEADALEAGSAIPRPLRQLSRGTADQLYLSVRLALCDLLLPRPVPLILDDALAAFDDERMARALDVLMEAAGRRQVLFFTCQSREGVYLRRACPGRFREVSL